MRGNIREIPITVNCAYSGGSESITEKITVKLNDANLNIWDDSISLKFNKTPVDFYIRAENPVSGVIITPDAKAYSFTTEDSGGGQYAILTLPWSTRSYFAAFSGATVDTEVCYSLGINKKPSADWTAFKQDPHNTAKYEPNNSEEEAAEINIEGEITAYLTADEIDYYEIKLGSTPPSPANYEPDAPTGLKVSKSSYSSYATLSWNPVMDAASYNIYRATSSGGTYSFYESASSTSYSGSLCSYSVSYYYKVAAVSFDGAEGEQSSYIACSYSSSY